MPNADQDTSSQKRVTQGPTAWSAGFGLFGAGSAAIAGHELVALGWICVVIGTIICLGAIIGWLSEH